MRGGPDGSGVDAREVLAGLLHDLRHLADVDLVVVSGDVADDGSREAYADTRALVGGWARGRGAASAYCTGNHDERQAFADVLGSGHHDAAGHDVGRLAIATGRAAVSHVAGHRLVTLDSLAPGEVPGRLGPAQLTWLGELLATPYRDGTVVVLHHPPVWPDREPQRSVGLQDAAGLAAAMAGSDVRVVLCGHFHAQLLGHLAGLPVWVGPGVVSRIDLTAPAPVERVVRGASATVLDLGGPGAPLLHLVHARDPQTGEQLGRQDAVEPVVEPAMPDDAVALLALREQAAAWLDGRGIRQWEPGEVDLPQVRRQVEAGEWHVAREGGAPVAALRLLEQDDAIWGPRPAEGVYVHGLVVDRRRAGEDLGGAAAAVGRCAGPGPGTGPAAARLRRGQRSAARLVRLAGLQERRAAGRRRGAVLRRAPGTERVSAQARGTVTVKGGQRSA